MPHRPQFSLVQLEALINAVTTGIVVCAPDGRVVAMNSAALVLHGMASAEEIHQRNGDFGPVFETSLPDGRTLPPEQWPGRLAAGGTDVREMELVVRRRDTGLTFTAAYGATAVRDEHGQVTLAIVTIHDITDVRRAVEGLRQRDLRLTAALAASGTGTFRWHVINDAFEPDAALERLLNASVTSLADVVRLIAESHRSRGAASFRACAVHGHDLEFEAPLESDRTQERWVAWRGRVLRDPDGRIVSLTGTASDVTTRRLVEDRLRQIERAESVGRLAGGVAHEVNNQMSVVLGCADFILRHPDLPDEVRADVEQMRIAGERSASITSQLLAFSRRQVLRSERVDVNEVVRGIAPALERTMGEGRRVRLRLSETPCPVRADVGQLQQVLLNLTLNARDATGAGGELRIETDITELGPQYADLHPDVQIRPGRYALLAASDSGHGMTRDTAGRVFEPFFTTKDVGRGTGLGLSTVYGIVKQSDGYIWVYSEPGLGTAFKIYLPLEAAVDPAPPRANPVAGAPPSGELVLVVEDETAVRSMVARVLADEGFRVIQADCAAAGLDAARNAGADLRAVVTDVIMPDLDGRTFARELHMIREVPVLFMSGYTDDDVVLRGLLDEGLPYLQKPFAPSALAQAVRGLLQPT